MSKEKYEYLEEIKEDVSGWIKEENMLAKFPNREDLEEYLNDVLFTEDSVTGNASGSYFMSTWKANLKAKKGLIVTGKQIGRASCRERVSSPV